MGRRVEKKIQWKGKNINEKWGMELRRNKNKKKNKNENKNSNNNKNKKK